MARDWRLVGADGGLPDPGPKRLASLDESRISDFCDRHVHVVYKYAIGQSCLDQALSIWANLS